MNILMVASENDALPGGKVGGIGDMVRDIPPALADEGHQINVITPGYGVFSQLSGAEFQDSVQVLFAGKRETIDLFAVVGKNPHERVQIWVLEHPLFASGGIGGIYCDDLSNRPFATDATKFALFCSAVCQAIEENHFGTLDVLHLHDWHAAIVAMLLAYDPQYNKLQAIDFVFTIHNLALQGIRPLAGDDSSLQTWIAAKTTVESAHLISLHNLTRRLISPSHHPLFVLTSVGRVTDQKVRILWQKISRQAAKERFLWSDVAKEYISSLYLG